jgi:hypothetical protein
MRFHLLDRFQREQPLITEIIRQTQLSPIPGHPARHENTPP